jgi:uncharacterized protein (DUF1499 family)
MSTTTVSSQHTHHIHHIAPTPFGVAAAHGGAL